MTSLTYPRPGLISCASDIVLVLLLLSPAGLHAAEGVRSDLLHVLDELSHDAGELLELVDRELDHADAAGLELQAVQRLLHLAQPDAAQLAALDEMALVVLAVLAAD